MYPSAGHVITGNLKVIPDSIIRNIVSKVQSIDFLPKPISIDVGKKLHLL